VRRALSAFGAIAGLTLAAPAVAPAAAAPCVAVGVYEDAPLTAVPRLAARTGAGLDALSVYVTAGQAIDPKVVALANARRLTLIVTWAPDAGKEGTRGRAYRLSRVAAGAFDPGLRTLAKTLKALKRPAILRPMPEPNTPWYAWSGLARGNRPAQYARAWRHVRTVVRKAAGSRVRLLWTPNAASIPNTAANAIARYFPGRANVDLVGVDGYNFGSAHGQVWTDPDSLFLTPYQTVERLARKPFWIGETGSTSVGGDGGAWIDTLGALGDSLPRLAGIVWYDVRDAATGDFRLTGTRATAFRRLLRGSCR
jgi:hypothetical protein